MEIVLNATLDIFNPQVHVFNVLLLVVILLLLQLLAMFAHVLLVPLDIICLD
jgi:hypothetical protein